MLFIVANELDNSKANPTTKSSVCGARNALNNSIATQASRKSPQ